MRRGPACPGSGLLVSLTDLFSEKDKSQELPYFERTPESNAVNLKTPRRTKGMTSQHWMNIVHYGTWIAVVRFRVQGYTVVPGLEHSDTSYHAVCTVQYCTVRRDNGAIPPTVANPT
jgi:hypothetical protein